MAIISPEPSRLAVGDADSVEQVLAQWAADVRYEDLPHRVVVGMKLLVRTIIGTTLAGAGADGCEAAVALVREWGGSPEATIWVHGGKAPLQAAAMANSVMARALDICDAQVPGQHIGTSLVPVALGMAERVGGVSGKSLLAALAAGSEIATRLGFVSRLDGFDPTGVCSIFAPCVAAGKLLRLDAKRMLNAMALAFNRAGGSFQSNIDASLAVRLIEGFISQDAVVCAQLAQRGLTGPKRWLSGAWGYYHLFCQNERDDETVCGGLGERWYLDTFGYKTRPQCGATISSTDAILALLAEHPFEPEDVASIDIGMANEAPYTLVGSPFELGENPEVSGQFNVRYCVANAIARKGAELTHFTREAVCDPRVGALARRIQTHLRPDLAQGRRERAAAVELSVRLTDGRVLRTMAPGPSGFPPLAKSQHAHLADFHAHAAFGGFKLAQGAVDRLLWMIDRLEEIDDVGELAPLLVSPAASSIRS